MPDKSSHGYYIALEEITGKPASVADLLKELSKIRRMDIFVCIAGIAELIQRDTFTPQVQLGFLKAVLPEDLWKQIAAAVHPRLNEPCTLFLRSQLWLLLQMTLLVGRDDAPELPEMEVKRQFAICALMASDILKQVELAPFPKSKEKDGLPLFIAIMISSTEMSFGHEVLARLSQLWLKIPEEPDILRQAERLGLTKSIDEAFADVHGIPLRDYFHMITIMLFKFTETIIKEVPIPLRFDPKVMFERSHDPETIDKAMRLVSSTPEVLAIELLAAPRQSWAHDFGPFIRKPVIKMSETDYICPDLHFLRNYFVQVIYELIVEALPNVNMKQLFGDLFARYVNKLIASGIPSSPLLGRVFHEKLVFETNTTAEACDGLLIWSSTAVLFEHKAGYLTTRQRYAMIPKETMAGVDSLLNKSGKDAKGVAQLAKNICRILSGEKLKSDEEVIDVAACKMIYPAIVVYDELLVNHGVRLHLQFAFDNYLKESGVDPSRIGPLLLFSIRDIEYFEELVEAIGAEKLIKDYAAFIRQNDRNPDCVFHIYANKHIPEACRRKGATDASVDDVLRSVMVDIEQRRRSRAES